MKCFTLWFVLLMVAFLILQAGSPALAQPVGCVLCVPEGGFQPTERNTPGMMPGVQTNGDYGISWWTVEGGGATFNSGGDYSLGGTVGQPDAGVLGGGVYTLSGGFWGGGAMIPPEYPLYLPVVMR